MSVAPMIGRQPRVFDVHCGWGSTAAAPQWNDINLVRAALAERGIVQAFLSANLARRYDMTAGNDALAAGLAASPPDSPTLLQGWLVIHSAQIAESNALLRKHLYSENFVGAALYPDPDTGTPVTLRENQEVINSFRRYGKPLLIEATTSEALIHAVEIADSLGGTKLIVSGMGGDEWHEALPYAVRPLNLYLDISGALAPEKIMFAIEIFHGTRKLLFGSGAPHTDPAAVLGMLDDIPLTADDRDRILYANAARLFQLGAGNLPPVSLSPLTSSADAGMTAFGAGGAETGG